MGSILWKKENYLKKEWKVYKKREAGCASLSRCVTVRCSFCSVLLVRLPCSLIHGLPFNNLRGDALGGMVAAVVPLALAFGVAPGRGRSWPLWCEVHNLIGGQFSFRLADFYFRRHPGLGPDWAPLMIVWVPNLTGI